MLCRKTRGSLNMLPLCIADFLGLISNVPLWQVGSGTAGNGPSCCCRSRVPNQGTRVQSTLQSTLHTFTSGLARHCHHYPNKEELMAWQLLLASTRKHKQAVLCSDQSNGDMQHVFMGCAAMKMPKQCWDKQWRAAFSVYMPTVACRAKKKTQHAVIIIDDSNADWG